jgi:hypothetical protein
MYVILYKIDTFAHREIQILYNKYLVGILTIFLLSTAIVTITTVSNCIKI